MENLIYKSESFYNEINSPENIATLILKNRHNLFLDDSNNYCIKKHFTNELFEYDEIQYKSRSLRQRFYYNIPSFPSHGNSEKKNQIAESFCNFRDSLKENVVEFLTPTMPILTEKDNFLENLVLRELLNNAIQSAYAVEKRLNIEKGLEYSDEYYAEKDYSNLLEVAFDKWIETDSDTKYDIIKLRNYAPYSKFHVDRIIERIQTETKDDNFFKFCQESMNATIYTGLSNIGLFMIKRMIDNKLSKLCKNDLFFTFEYVHINGFEEVGAYEFTLILPDCINNKDNLF